MRLALALSLALAELVWYAVSISRGWFQFPEGIPIQICDLILWATVLAALTMRPFLLELAYFGGLAGCGMALLTPDLWAPLCSYPSIQFFVAHGLVVANVLFLRMTGQFHCRPGAPWRVWAVLNGYVLFLAGFNLMYDTNYGYLCRPPAQPSLLDYLGPWPFYILSGELVAVGLLWVVYLSCRQPRKVAKE